MKSAAMEMKTSKGEGMVMSLASNIVALKGILLLRKQYGRNGMPVQGHASPLLACP